jgi:hypothetical protein
LSPKDQLPAGPFIDQHGAARCRWRARRQAPRWDVRGTGAVRARGKPLWHTAPPAPYPGSVFGIQVKRPQTTAQRCLNVAQAVLFPIVVVTLIVLKLTGVISWSWWWVLSPMWISGILLALGVFALLIGSRWYAHRRARLWMDQLGSEWLREFITGKADPDSSGGNLRLGDGEGQAPSRSDG